MFKYAGYTTGIVQTHFNKLLRNI